MAVQQTSSDAAADAIHQRKKRYYDRRVRPFPRILKRDIRRLYARMFINVLNSADHGLMYRFFRQFLSPKSATLVHYFPKCEKHGFRPMFVKKGEF